MTKKDYELISGALVKTATYMGSGKQTIYALAIELTERFEANDPKFKRHAFLADLAQYSS